MSTRRCPQWPWLTRASALAMALSSCGAEVTRSNAAHDAAVATTPAPESPTAETAPPAELDAAVSEQAAYADAGDVGALADAASQRGAPSRVGVRLPVSQTSDAELRLLTRARRTLLKSPAKALALTVDHQRAFSAPRHAERRELVAIEALVRLGRGAEARARARHFYGAFPGSAEHARVRELVAGAPP